MSLVRFNDHLRISVIFEAEQSPQINADYEPATEYQKRERASIEILARERVIAIGCHDGAGFVAALRQAADEIERQMQGASNHDR